ncbi:MAG TPA: DUF3089 domain-containing protein, partial [Chitinophagales bacterium]|nr:DUF3089 domain-containing protein [Chitinophagales bacterium]
MQKQVFSFLVLVLILNTYSISAQKVVPFNAANQPPAPDYSQEKYWSALPFRTDAADILPAGEKWAGDSLKNVDVFYIYPTVYVKGKTWNADNNNKKQNKRVDTKPVRYQASVFNASCRVYAPRYRQARLLAFYNKEEGEKALAFAYQDVKRAFEYYLAHYNHGRPIIIASHSQGTYHARRLLGEYFDTTALRKQLVAAYVIGYGFKKGQYKNLQPCNSPTQIGCYITWASFKNGYDPGNSVLCGNVCVNPITWNSDTIAIPASQSAGSMLLSFKKVYQHSTGAQVHNGYLWVKTTMPIIRHWNVMHLGDYNLFWYDIRKN